MKREYLSDERVYLLKQFALYQRQRTLGENEFAKQTRTELLVESVKCVCAHNGWVFDRTAREMCFESAKEGVSPTANLQIVESISNIISDLGVVIIKYNTRENNLISSDVPVVAINPFYKPNIGYGCMGLILLFPISPKHLVVIYDQKMYPRFNGQQYIVLNNEREVQNLNALQLASAEQILFAISPSDFNSLTSKNWDFRNISRNKKATASLGTPEQPLIITQMRNTIFDCEFTFGKLCSAFDNIPFLCREAVPRKWEDECELKLKSKGDILLKISESDPNMLLANGISRKECKRGCQAMLAATKRYWNVK